MLQSSDSWNGEKMESFAGSNPSAPGEKPGAASFSQDYGMTAPGKAIAASAISKRRTSFRMIKQKSLIGRLWRQCEHSQTIDIG